MIGRLRHWWDGQLARRSEEAAARRAVLASIPIDAADRVASLLLRVPPLTDAIDVSTPAAIEVYMRGLHERLGGLTFGHETQAYVLREPTHDVDGRQTVASNCFEDDVRRRSGELTVVEDDPADVRPSVVHFVLENCLGPEEIAALAADPMGWRPDLVKQPMPHALPRPREPLTVVTKSHLGEGLLLLPCAVVALALALMLMSFFFLEPFAVLICSAFVLLFAYLLARRAVYCLWHSPRARRLAIDARGLRAPEDGALVPWEHVRTLDRYHGDFVLTLADGARVIVPSNHFVDARAADAHLRTRIGKVRAPYRGR